MSLIIGLTGGIGSGKSAVSDRFQSHGIAVVDADVVAREVVEPGSECLAAIAEHFGKEILLENGTLDRARLRKIIFSDPAEKQWLEALLHPAIFAETARQLEAATSPYAIYVSPLLVESGQSDFCQRLLVVDVPVELQVERTMQRDDNDEAQVRRIIASQASREQRQSAADDIICNDGSLEALLAHVDELHERYLQLAAQG